MNNAAVAFGVLVLAGLGVVVLPALAAPSYIDQYIDSVTVTTTTEEITTEEITTEEVTTINAAASADLIEEDSTVSESEAFYEEIQEG